MTLPVPNLQAAIAEVKKDPKGALKAYLIPPWNSWFQQFSQPAPAVQAVIASPFTANAIGNVIIQGAATIALTRGSTVFNLTGETIIPIGIGDILSWTGGATVSFLG